MLAIERPDRLGVDERDCEVPVVDTARGESR
jgi:hypothetical protein